MANRNDYRNMLGERFENAYKTKNEFKRPSETEMAKWKHLAKLRRKEKRRQAKIVASLASVFEMVFCFSVVSLFQLPDAEAGEDQIVDIQDWKDNEEFSKVDVYLDYSDLPEEVKEEFCIDDDLPCGYSLSELTVTTIGEKRNFEGKFKNKEGGSFNVKQTLADDYTQVLINSDKIETWNGLDVYIKYYTNGEHQTGYMFIVDDNYVYILANDEVDEGVIKELIEAI